MSHLGSNQPGSKHVPGAIAILLLSNIGNNFVADSGKVVKLVKRVFKDQTVRLQMLDGHYLDAVAYSPNSNKLWMVEATNMHIHLTKHSPFCMLNNCYKQSELLIIGDESLVKDEPTVEQLRQTDVTWNIIHKELSKV
jgi:hypothetical protein